MKQNMFEQIKKVKHWYWIHEGTTEDIWSEKDALKHTDDEFMIGWVVCKKTLSVKKRKKKDVSNTN